MIWGLLLVLWGLFGAAAVVLMIYGSFTGVALNEPIMAAILATGTALIAGAALMLSRRR